MAYTHHIYAKNIDGELMHIDEVERGEKCNCICSVCKSPLVAKHGDFNEHHFSHKSKSNCQGETLAHLKAKEIISKSKYLQFPDAANNFHKVNFDKVEVENLINDSEYRADLICHLKEKKYVVEIVVTSEISQEKLNYLRENKIDTFKIDLRKSYYMEDYNKLPNNFHKIVLDIPDNKRWIFNNKISFLKNEYEELIASYHKLRAYLDSFREKLISETGINKNDKEDFTEILFLFIDVTNKIFNHPVYQTKPRWNPSDTDWLDDIFRLNDNE
jgi:hypothetical protein